MTTILYSAPPLFLASAAGPANSPLSPEHLAQLEASNQRAKKIRRAAAVATTDAWLSAIFAALTLLSAIFSPVSAILGLALAVIAFNSFRGAKRLRQLDPSAPHFLACNQIALALALVTYAACSLYAAAHASSNLLSSATSAGPDVEKALGDLHLDRLYWLASLALYGTLIVGTVLAQGLAAIYYATRKKHIDAYLAATPGWILQLQKTQVGS